MCEYENSFGVHDGKTLIVLQPYTCSWGDEKNTEYFLKYNNIETILTSIWLILNIEYYLKNL